MLFGKRNPFYPYERAIVEAVIAALPASLDSLFRAQLEQIGHVQRSPASPEINFYRGRTGGEWDPKWLLPNRDEIRLADVNVQISGRRHRGILYAVSGHLFSLVLRPEVRRGKRAILEEIDVSVADVDLLTDRQTEGTPGGDIVPVSFLEDERRVSEPNIASWAVLEPADVYLVSLPDAEWAVLAQGPRGHLLLGRRGEARESFCLANVEDDVIRPLAASSWQSALGEAKDGAS